MKVQTLATLAVFLRLSCTLSAQADTIAVPSVDRIVMAIESSGVHRAQIAGDSLAVLDRNTGHYVFSVRLVNGGEVELVASGTGGGSEDEEGVDMHHLDHAAIGVIALDARTRLWQLVHRVDLARLSDDSFEDILDRFTSAAANASVRYSQTISSRR